MIFTKTTKYALRTLNFMSASEGAVYSADRLHKELKIPKKYLQRMLTDLARSGLLKSVRGRNGGFIFASRSTKKITIADIIESVEGLPATPTCFFGFDRCALDNPCAMHEVWSKTQHSFLATISSTSLFDLVHTKV
jgi:Rrf2 family protein